MKEQLTTFLLPIILPIIITLFITIFSKIFPKEKAVKIAKKCNKFGIILSKFGNTKLGKKTMDKFEEGAIVTILAFFVTCITEFSKGLILDNKKGDF